MDDRCRTARGVAPAVGKVLELGLLVLFVAGLVATLYGGTLPSYRTTAGDEVAERALATAAQRIHRAVPPNATAASGRFRLELPATIRGRAYAVSVADRSLVLDHPHPAVEATAPLALPASVVSVDGRVESTERAAIVVESVPGGVTVRLEEGPA